jgi:hypothetical protein
VHHAYQLQLSLRINIIPLIIEQDLRLPATLPHIVLAAQLYPSLLASVGDVLTPSSSTAYDGC